MSPQWPPGYAEPGRGLSPSRWDSKRCLKGGVSSCRTGSATFTGRHGRPLRKAGKPASSSAHFDPVVSGVHFCCD
ncbi:hypothetical protein NGK36_20815 [Hafnia alvei]|uniref:hypothetical protein n=1 Tax=Hafnia alvei TaxID=569 RepID=UPI002DBBC75B|nr:hypothetical protein [Hafnia alvei]MEB7891706.1 hypothetical protein [Hafnia alvei]